MPDRRPKRTGSFGGHFDELVKHFTQRTSAAKPARSAKTVRVRLDKRDIHAQLFERAWRTE